MEVNNARPLRLIIYRANRHDIFPVSWQSSSSPPPHGMALTFRLLWESIISAILPIISVMHISWMFRVNGISPVVSWADWLYDFTFDTFTRVVSSDPEVPKPKGSFIWRLLFDRTYRQSPTFPVSATLNLFPSSGSPLPRG